MSIVLTTRENHKPIDRIRANVRHIDKHPGTIMTPLCSSQHSAKPSVNGQTDKRTDKRTLPSALSPCFAKATRSIKIHTLSTDSAILIWILLTAPKLITRFHALLVPINPDSEHDRGPGWDWSNHFDKNGVIHALPKCLEGLLEVTQSS